jgi:predicted transcriptional regulator
MKIKDAMHKGAEWVAPATSVYDIAKKMRDLDIGAIPVGDNDRLIGMVTDRDIAYRRGQGTPKLGPAMWEQGIIFCKDTEELEGYLEQKRCVLPLSMTQKRMVSAASPSLTSAAELSGGCG